ncbi:MAG: hypothetical protein WC450_03445 [Candidatus Omnitrophota bacterium]|jgi:hypothetical protein
MRLKFKSLLIIGLILSAPGCFHRPIDETLIEPLTEPEKKLVELCKKDYGLNIVLRRMANTLWIYVPTEDQFLHLKVSEDGPKPAQPPDAALAIHFIDVDYKDGTFTVRYDIGKTKKSTEDPGYSLQYVESFSNLRQRIPTAIGRAFADVEENEKTGEMQERVEGDVDYGDSSKQASHKTLVQSYVKTNPVPEFFVVVIADIKNGMESKMTFYFKDLRRGMTDPSFTEEYTRRVISETPTGYAAIIGDKLARHVKFDNITWPKFLSQLIAYRIRYKFAISSHTPSDDIDKEVLKVTATTLDIYPFSKFHGVLMKNLDTEQDFTYLKEELSQYIAH